MQQRLVIIGGDAAGMSAAAQARRLRNVDGTTSTHDLSYDASHRGIVLFRDERWPRGGQVRYELTVTRARADQRWEYSVRVQAQFHAGGHATIVLPDHEFDLDLASGSLRAVQ